MSETPLQSPTRVPQPPLFALGQIVATPAALEACSPEYLRHCLSRHIRGDWGIICPEDQARNVEALTECARILSAYPIDPARPCNGNGFGDNCLWIITEADRSATTFLLPSEY